ncbi:MAG TPA: hypothetical protein VHQ47_08185 [Phycisphaerae bacterium]|jgi:hypothetical protein|nr:hypothetical protein [Phycisphaerae bacterium]
MKFVKANLFLLVCGAIVLLALIAIYWPLSFAKAAVTDKATARYNEAQGASALSMKISIPFVKEPIVGPPSQEIIDLKKRIQENVKKQADEITVQAGKDNERGRTTGDPQHPIPLLNGTPEANFLPAIKLSAGANPQGFKDAYNKVFPVWMAELTGSSVIHPAPPVYNEVSADFERTQHVTASGQGGAAALNDAKNTYIRNEVIRRAQQIRMYVDDEALQKEHEWADRPEPPTADQIFVAIVESWLQKDIVDAISAVNGDSKNVGDSPIKRLERITIGGDGGVPGGIASGAGRGSLFLEPPNITGTNTTASSSTATNGLDPSRTLTGHVGGGSYDTVLVGISLDLDPAYENRFFDELYRRNNGYTVLDVRTAVVDPFDAASNGYLYGKKQVVHIDVLVEALFYRSWTVPLMPAGIQATGGVVGGSNRSMPNSGSPNMPSSGGGGGGGGYVPPVDNSL